MAMRKLKKRLRALSKYALILTALLMGNGKEKSPPAGIKDTKTRTEQKAPVKPTSPSVKHASREVTYQTDTLDVPPFATAYNTGNEIIRNFVPNHSGYILSLPVLAHEQKHKDNYKRGLRSQKLTPLLYAKMCMHDEISANICELLTMRYEYLAAETEKRRQEILKKYGSGRFGYYFNAVKEGQIHPNANDENSRQEEWKFIAQQTQKTWMEKRFPAYRPGITRMVERYLGRMEENIPLQTVLKGYQKVLNIAYNIGGIDFGKYMEHDISFEDNTIEMMDKISKINLYGGDKKYYRHRVQINIEKLKKKNQPLSSEIIAHIYIAEGLKMSLKGISKDILLEHPEIVSTCYNKIYSQFSKSKDAQKLLRSTLEKEGFSPIPFNTQFPSDEMAELYTYKGINLSKMVFGFQENPKESSIFDFDVQLSLLEYNSIKAKLSDLRKISPKEKSANAKKVAAPKVSPRRSAPLSLFAPNFNEPILRDISEEQTQEIYNCIRKFDSIPDVMKGCDLNAQDAYLKKQNSR